MFSNKIYHILTAIFYFNSQHIGWNWMLSANKRWKIDKPNFRICEKIQLLLNYQRSLLEKKIYQGIRIIISNRSIVITHGVVEEWALNTEIEKKIKSILFHQMRLVILCFQIILIKSFPHSSRTVYLRREINTSPKCHSYCIVKTTWWILHINLLLWNKIK